MDILRIVLTIIYVIDCIALTVIILMQEGKDAGLRCNCRRGGHLLGQNKGRSMEGPEWSRQHGSCPSSLHSFSHTGHEVHH